MFDLLSKSPTINLLDRGMTLASRRMELIASNVANIDTPGYHARDLDFQSVLRAEMGGSDASGWQSMPSHFTQQTHLSAPAARAAGKPAAERNDGNDVSLDREAMNLSITQQTYQICSSLAQVEIRRTYQVIREGMK